MVGMRVRLENPVERQAVAANVVYDLGHGRPVGPPGDHRESQHRIDDRGAGRRGIAHDVAQSAA